MGWSRPTYWVKASTTHLPMTQVKGKTACRDLYIISWLRVIRYTVLWWWIVSLQSAPFFTESADSRNGEHQDQNRDESE
jgi:hypothetical protein